LADAVAYKPNTVTLAFCSLKKLCFGETKTQLSRMTSIGLGHFAYPAGISRPYTALNAVKAGQCLLKRSLNRLPVLISRPAR